MRKFLTARWQDLIMANYEVDPSLLAPRVPAGTELDLQDGKCFVSLVGFMFLDTRVWGLPIPFHVNFEEVNLRFYVKRVTEQETRRGVVFIKEIVPKFAIAWVARTFYGEPYETLPMSNRTEGGSVGYGWTKGKGINWLRVEVGENLGVPKQGSHEEFIIEHYWGYTKRDGNRTDEYKVEHPKWELFSTQNTELNVNFYGVYGEELGFLKGLKPQSALFSRGSEIAVYKGERIK
jgi:uncharacterized protein YqjF (DUF2071 family)